MGSDRAAVAGEPLDPHPLGCHRPRRDDRECFEAILHRLVTGCSWDVAGRLGKGSETTLRRRFNEWTDAGVFDELADEAIEGYDRIVGLDLSEVAVDGSQHKAPFGGEGTGPNPTDRAKNGWKWSIATDRWGIPLGWEQAGANRNDCILLEPTLDAVEGRGLLVEIETLHLDRGYDNGIARTLCVELGLDDVVCAKRRPRGSAKTKLPLPLGMQLVRGAHQQLAVELRAAPSQHRPVHPPTPRPVRPRRRRDPDRQAHQVGRPLEPRHLTYWRAL